MGGNWGERGRGFPAPANEMQQRMKRTKGRGARRGEFEGGSGHGMTAEDETEYGGGEEESWRWRRVQSGVEDWRTWGRAGSVEEVDAEVSYRMYAKRMPRHALGYSSVEAYAHSRTSPSGAYPVARMRAHRYPASATRSSQRMPTRTRGPLEGQHGEPEQNAAEHAKGEQLSCLIL